MVAFVIFWSSFFCLIFFLAETVFKLLASCLAGFVESGIKTIKIIIIAALTVFGLFLLYDLYIDWRAGGIGRICTTLLMLAVLISLIIGLFGGLGRFLLEMVINIVDAIINVVYSVFEKAAVVCEKAYIHFLNSIIVRLDKC